jgi:hypothetical protein
MVGVFLGLLFLIVIPEALQGQARYNRPPFTSSRGLGGSFCEFAADWCLLP